MEVRPGEIHVLYSDFPLAKTDKAAELEEREARELYGMKSNRTIKRDCVIRGNVG